MDEKTTAKKIANALEKGKKRKFTQSVELIFNFSVKNMESAESKLNLSVVLPKGRGKEMGVGVFADGDMNVRAKKLSKHVLDKKGLEEYSKSKRKMRTFANGCYNFIAQPDLMSTIGKTWGIVLGPRGKMPQPIPPTADLDAIFKKLGNTVKIRSKKNPTIHVPIGVETMSVEDLTENAIAVYNAITVQISIEDIKSVYVKTTMGEAVVLW